MTSRAGRGSLAVRIIADPSQFKRGIREADQATEGFKGRMKMASKVVAGAILFTAGRAVTTFVRDSKQAYMDLNESLNAVQVTYGDNAEAIARLGREAATSVGLSTAQFNSLAVAMSAFAHEIAGPGGDVVEVVDEMTTRIADFASVMNLEVSEAAAKFQSGLAGQSRPLREFGIDVSDAAVQAHALAAGIWDGNGAMTESEKVQGRYGLIMEQTAKTAGDFANTSEELANQLRISAAEAENNKAIMGEAMLPVWVATTKVGTDLAKAAGLMALGFLDLTGKITEADEALTRFNITQGRAATTADDVAHIFRGLFTDIGKDLDRDNRQVEDLTQNIIDLLSAVELAPGEFELLKNATDEQILSMGLAESQIDDYRLALTRIENESNQVRGALSLLDSGVDELGEGFDDLGDEVDEATHALVRHREEVNRQINPLFAYLDQLDRVTEAQRASTEARNTYGEGSPEHRDAVMGEWRERERLADAVAQMAQDFGMSMEEVREHLQTTVGMSKEATDMLLADLMRYNAFQFDTKVMHIATRQTGGAGQVGFRQHGGPVRRGKPYVVGEEGPELFVPSQSGAIKTAGNGHSANGGATFNITVHAGWGADGHAIGEEIVNVLQQFERRNGPLPLKTRQA